MKRKIIESNKSISDVDLLQTIEPKGIADEIEDQNIPFHLSPKQRFVGELTEHQTFFLEDPFYNYLEFKFYQHFEAIFGRKEFTAIGDHG